MCWNAKYALLLLSSTFVTYLGGLGIKFCREHLGERRTKLGGAEFCVLITVVINIALLVFFKYADFLIESINVILETINIQISIQTFDVLLPVGISFYIFQALSYTIDVYRDEIYPEKKFLKYALFVSFFPQLVAGPIERSKNLLLQLNNDKKLDSASLIEGLLLMIWGFFLKIVIADRAAIVVDTVYGDLSTYAGVYTIIASVLFAFQIYCDFYGYSIIAKGAAKILGIDLMDNFNAPYLSASVSEFWRRWHVSLSSWFRDYLYIPLGGNRKGIARKHINLLIVFAVSGLWHGANWTFVIWGVLNGIFQIVGEWCKKIRDWVIRVLVLDKSALSHRILQIVITFVLVDLTWIFFRANTLTDALTALKNIFVYNPWVLFDGSLYLLGLDQKNFQVLIYALMLLVFIDICNYKGIRVRGVIMKQEYWFKSAVIIVGILFVTVFGIWGSAYDSTSFIYFQF